MCRSMASTCADPCRPAIRAGGTLGWRIDRIERKQKCSRHGKWKLVVDGPHDVVRHELLFDLESDISERDNVAFEHPEVLADLRKRLDAWEADVDAHPCAVRREVNPYRSLPRAAGSSIATQSPGCAFRAAIRPECKLDGPAGDRQTQANAATGAAPVAADPDRRARRSSPGNPRERLDHGPGPKPSRVAGLCRSSTTTAVPSAHGARRCAARSRRRGGAARLAAHHRGSLRVTLKRHPFAPASSEWSSARARTRSRTARFFGLAGRGVALGLRQLQELFDQHGEAADLAGDPVERGLGVLTRTGQLDGEGEPGQGRTRARATRPGAVAARRTPESRFAPPSGRTDRARSPISSLRVDRTRADRSPLPNRSTALRRSPERTEPDARPAA